MSNKKIITLLVTKDILSFLLGTAVALRIEAEGGENVMFLPLFMILLVFLGWQLKDLQSNCK